MSDEFFALIMKVQCFYYYSSPPKMWILEKSILEVLGQKYLKFAIVPWLRNSTYFMCIPKSHQMNELSFRQNHLIVYRYFGLIGNMFMKFL